MKTTTKENRKIRVADLKVGQSFLMDGFEYEVIKIAAGRIYYKRENQTNVYKNNNMGEKCQKKVELLG